MNDLEFRMTVFNGTKARLIDESLDGDFFSVCAIDKIVDLSALDGGREGVRLSDCYRDLESIHCNHFKNMSDELLVAIAYKINDVVNLIEATYAKKEPVRNGVFFSIGRYLDGLIEGKK